MKKSIDQALSSLLPTLNVPPSSLVDLSSSFLAQSRYKAGSLKPEEEIARTYACAHLACDRSKQSLNLPSIDPRPPCPPRVYNKLFRYFSNVLPGHEPRTPKKQRLGTRKGEDGVSSPSRIPQRANSSNPSQVQTPDSARSAGRKRKIRSLIAHECENDVPAWAMPAIRHLCKTLDAPAATPHVYAGLCSVLSTKNMESMTLWDPAQSTLRFSEPPRSSRSATTHNQAGVLAYSKDDIIAAIIVVLYLYTMTRLSASDISQGDYVSQKAKAIAAIQETRPLDEIDADGFSVLIERLIREAQSGWLDLEWFTNIPEGQGVLTTSAFVALTEHLGANEEGERSAFPDGREDTIRPGATDQSAVNFEHGLSSMFVQAVDYLSDERRQDYKEWRANIMKRIEAKESQRMVNSS